MTNRRDAWTKKEYRTLKRLYPNTSVEDIGALLGRTPSAVQSKVAVLRLKKENAKNMRTENEILLLREIYPYATNDTVAERMGRSPDAIKSIAKRLGLMKAFRWTPIQLAYIRKNYSEKGRHYIAKKFGRSPDVVRDAARKLGVSRKTHHKRWTKKEEEQLKQLLTNRTCEEIAKILDRPIGSVKMKCYDMKLQQG